MGYVRFGAWRGTPMIIPAAIPLVAAELALATDWSGDLLVGWLDISRPPLLVAVLIAVAAIVGGALAARRMTAGLQLRVTPGWTTL